MENPHPLRIYTSSLTVTYNLRGIDREQTFVYVSARLAASRLWQPKARILSFRRTGLLSVFEAIRPFSSRCLCARSESFLVLHSS